MNFILIAVVLWFLVLVFVGVLCLISTGSETGDDHE